MSELLEFKIGSLDAGHYFQFGFHKSSERTQTLVGEYLRWWDDSKNDTPYPITAVKYKGIELHVHEHPDTLRKPVNQENYTIE